MGASLDPDGSAGGDRRGYARAGDGGTAPSPARSGRPSPRPRSPRVPAADPKRAALRDAARAAAEALAGRNLVLAGPPGGGKSTLGREAARALGRDFVDTDAAIERQSGRPIPRIFALQGEDAFRDLEAGAIAGAAAAGQPPRVLAVGGGALLRAENVAALRATGFIVCLRARPEVLLQRTRGAAGGARRPLLGGSDPLQRIRELLERRAAAYAQADADLETSDLDRAGALLALLRLCGAAAGGGGRP